MRYVIGNYLNDSVTITPSSEDSIYVKQYLYNQRPSLPFRFTGKADENIVFDFGEAKTITIIALVNHNLTSNAILKIQANSVNDFTTPPVDLNFTYHKGNVYLILNETYQYWKLIIQDSQNTNNIQIGELIFNQYKDFSKTFNWGYKTGKNYNVLRHESPFGQSWKQYLSDQREEFYTFDAIEDAKLKSEVEQFFDDLKGSESWFLLIPDPDEPECYYVEILNQYEAIIRYKNNNEFELSLKEHVEGIDLL
jgi:hypothetical protein